MQFLPEVHDELFGAQTRDPVEFGIPDASNVAVSVGLEDLLDLQDVVIGPAVFQQVDQLFYEAVIVETALVPQLPQTHVFTLVVGLCLGHPVG